MAEGDIQQVSNSVADIALEQFKEAFAKITGKEIGENKISFNEIANKLKGLLEEIEEEEKIKDNKKEEKIDDNKLKQIYKIIFTLRQVLTNVQYSFQIGIDAVYEGQQRLVEYNISQNKLFEDVNANFRISNGDLLLAKELEAQTKVLKERLKISKKDYFSDDPNKSKESILSKHWDKIMKSISSIEEGEIGKEGKKGKKGNKKGRKGDLMYLISSWSHTDENGVITKSGFIRNYYHYRNGDWEYFNKGWIFEWGKTLGAQLEAHLETLQKTKGEGKEITGKEILSFILKHGYKDTLRGYLYGDYYQEIEGGFEAIQAKRGNARIMTFNDLKRTLRELSELFKSLSAKISNTEEMEGVIKGYFNAEDDKGKLESEIHDFIDTSIKQTVDNFQNIFSG